MSVIEVTRQARDELRGLIETRQLPADTRERVSRSLLTLEEFPRAGKQLSGVWRDCRALIGPWGWLIVVYMYFEAEDRVVVIAFHDARTSRGSDGAALNVVCRSDAAISGPAPQAGRGRDRVPSEEGSRSAERQTIARAVI